MGFDSFAGDLLSEASSTSHKAAATLRSAAALSAFARRYGSTGRTLPRTSGALEFPPGLGAAFVHTAGLRLAKLRSRLAAP